MSISLMIAIIVMGGWAVGRIFQRLKVPGILGMLIWGISVTVIFDSEIPVSLWGVIPFFSTLALIVILLRAGLGINKKMLRQTGISALLMGFVPCLVESLGLILALHFIMGFPYVISALAAFMLAAVSPAVVVPSMLDLKAGGYGEKKQVPTLVLAGASVDDVVAFSFFTLALSAAVSQEVNLLESIFKIPYALGGGILFGLALGFAMLWFFKLMKQRLRATEKLLVLMCISFFLVELGAGIGIAALLGTMTIGFVIFEKANKLAHELSRKLSKWWLIAEIILFVSIGMSVKLQYISSAGLKALLVIVIGLLFRSLGVVIATSSSSLNKREKLFCVIAYLPKATVQAALGAIPLSMGVEHGEIILALAVISILFTAPLGALLIKGLGPKLLKGDMERV